MVRISRLFFYLTVFFSLVACMGSPEDIEDIFSGEAPVVDDVFPTSVATISSGSHIAKSTSLTIRARSGRVAFAPGTSISSANLSIRLGLQREVSEEVGSVDF